MLLPALNATAGIPYSMDAYAAPMVPLRVYRKGPRLFPALNPNY